MKEGNRGVTGRYKMNTAYRKRGIRTFDLVCVCLLVVLEGRAARGDGSEAAGDLITDDDMDKCHGLFDEQLPDVHPNGHEWTQLKRGIPEGMKVWGQLVEGTNTFNFRVSGQLQGVSVEGLIKTMESADWAERHSWDPTCLKLDKIASQGNNDIFVWLVDFPWPLYDREYVMRRRLDRHDHGGAASISRIVANSTQLLQHDPTVVRISDFVQLATARPLEDGSGSKFHLFYRNDLNAPMPLWLVKWFSQTALPSYLSQIKAQSLLFSEALSKAGAS